MIADGNLRKKVGPAPGTRGGLAVEAVIRLWPSRAVPFPAALVTPVPAVPAAKRAGRVNGVDPGSGEDPGRPGVPDPPGKPDPPGYCPGRDTRNCLAHQASLQRRPAGHQPSARNPTAGSRGQRSTKIWS